MIAHITNDLMMASTAKATAAAAGHEYRSFGSLTKLEAALAEYPVKLLLVDMQLPSLDLDLLTSFIQTHFSRDERQVVGYAQHVAVELLEKAQSCGFTAVMTRGQINSGMGRLFGTLD